MRLCFLLVLLGAACTGCKSGFQKDRTLRAIHIVGIGWLVFQDGTNVIRAFTVGSLKATNLRSIVQTNAAFIMRESTNTVEK
jgi:hypothetical protein